MRIIWIDWSKEKSGEGSKYTAVAAVAPLVLRHLLLFYHLLNPRHTLHPHHHTPPHTPPPPHHHHFIIFSPSSPLQHWQSQSRVVIFAVAMTMYLEVVTSLTFNGTAFDTGAA